MKTVSLPGLAHPLSQVVLGTMNFGDTVDASASAAIVHAAVEAGITVLDTANGYAGGRCEEILAGILPGIRDKVILASKAGIPHPDAGDASPLSPAGLRAAVEGSLKRLKTERIDLFYLHQPDRKADIHDTLNTVQKLVAEGKIGALGVSNFSAWQILEAIQAAREVGAPRPVIAQQLYNLTARRIEEEYAEFAGRHGVHTMVYNPLGGGLLTGRHRFEAPPTSGRFGDSRLAAMYRQRYWDERLFAAIAELQAIAEGAGLSLVELAFRWLLSKPVTGSILVGCSRPEQLAANLAFIAAGPLPADVTAACDNTGAALRGPMPAYNR